MADSKETGSGSPVIDRDVEEQHRLARFDRLISQATLQYSMKSYDAAAELYAHAAELQAEINGEMSTKNADLLYAYGRCLYHVAVRKSDVLGSKVAGEKPVEKPAKKKVSSKAEPSGRAGFQGNEGPVNQKRELQPKSRSATEEADEANKPYFQFTGDENFDTSDEEEVGEEAGEDGEQDEEDEEEDDFANAFEVLDMARLLLLQKIDEDKASAKLKDIDDGLVALRHSQERLADTYDLQAEISLEGERFQDAAMDLRSALDWKTRLFPPDSSLFAEAHYKLSLALEFSSVTKPRNEKGEILEEEELHVDYTMRSEAAKEMEAAIASCKLRINEEENKLEGKHQGEDGSRAQADSKEIEDVKEMVSEMEQRLTELRQPPVSINDARGAGAIDGTTPLIGVLGAMLGKSADAKQTGLEALQGANDLTSLVKKRKTIGDKGHLETSEGNQHRNEKRKAGFIKGETAMSDKKAKVETSEVQ